MKVCDSFGLAYRDSRSPAPLPSLLFLSSQQTNTLQQLQDLTPSAVFHARDAMSEQVKANKAFAGDTGSVFIFSPERQLIKITRRHCYFCFVFPRRNKTLLLSFKHVGKHFKREQRWNVMKIPIQIEPKEQNEIRVIRKSKESPTSVFLLVIFLAVGHIEGGRTLVPSGGAAAAA